MTFVPIGEPKGINVYDRFPLEAFVVLRKSTATHTK
nr:MAG TPA: hypothetical protein [Caudoviricetes sp.]